MKIFGDDPENLEEHSFANFCSLCRFSTRRLPFTRYNKNKKRKVRQKYLDRHTIFMYTAVKPSRRVPGALGLFAAKDLKRGTVLIPSTSVAPPPTTGPSSSTPAALCQPPLTTNLIFLPQSRKQITFFEFVLLRNQWTSPDKCFIVPHDRAGVFLVMPRSLIPEGRLILPSSHNEVFSSSTSSKGLFPGRSKREYRIPEEHFFHVNEAFPWSLPPSEDLASPAYWSRAKEQCGLYRQLMLRSAEGMAEDLLQQQQEVVAAGVTFQDPTVPQEKEGLDKGARWTAAEQTEAQSELRSFAANCQMRVHFPRLRNRERKKPVARSAEETQEDESADGSSKRRSQDDDDETEEGHNSAVSPLNRDDVLTGVPMLTLVRAVKQGEELTVHYGLEWWAQMLLSRVFLAASDDQLGKVRWIESLVAASLTLNNAALSSSNGPPPPPEGSGSMEDAAAAAVGGGFPLLKLCWRRKKRQLPSAPRRKKKLVDLGSVLDREIATREQLVAFAVRRSCQSAAFLRLLVQFGFRAQHQVPVSADNITNKNNSTDPRSSLSPSCTYRQLRVLLIECLLFGDEVALERRVSREAQSTRMPPSSPTGHSDDDKPTTMDL